MSNQNFTQSEINATISYVGSKASAKMALIVMAGIVVLSVIGSLLLGYDPIPVALISCFLSSFIGLPFLLMFAVSYPDTAKNARYEACAKWLHENSH